MRTGISASLITQLDETFNDRIAGLTWGSQILLNGSGSSAKEDRIGADMLIHVSLKTPTQNYSKGVLVQAKRAGPDDYFNKRQIGYLNRQCLTMLNHTAASFVFAYSYQGMRCGAATRFSGSSDPRIYKQCTWTTYRFFLELFRCPIGDIGITSDRVDDLPVPRIIHLRGNGVLDDE